ncbi:MAG: aminotransferase class III-fold pyridoxal phosphate-dependent enzyme, partial [Chloroflexi bacterium]|nr:aminotransferase class III-fold pyridoxal phosphate-dependent enzyme [Chloroflexota bacterium]
MTDHAKERLSPVWLRYGEVEVERGEGVWLIDRQGNRYLDFTSGIAVVSTGHAHPQVVRAVQEQAAKLLHGQANLVYHQPLLELVEALAQVMPHPSLDTFFLSNSGAEAVEASIKLAKQATGRPNLIAFQGGFHGRTYGALSLTTSKTLYRVGLEPLLGGIYFAPFPYPYRMAIEPEACGQVCLEQLETMLTTQVDPRTVAAMIVEPILGEGGYVFPPRNFLPGLRAICDKHGILLILDEVQTGFGRTGKMFAVEHTGVRPDILVMAKGIASGLPLSAIAAPRSLMEK